MKNPVSLNSKNPRHDWEPALKKMCANNDDQLLIPDVFNEENFEEWD